MGCGTSTPSDGGAAGGATMQKAVSDRGINNMASAKVASSSTDTSSPEHILKLIEDSSMQQTVSSRAAPKLMIEVADLHTYMPRHLKDAPMRLLYMEKVLHWTSLKVYEALQPDEFLSIPYSSTSETDWHSTALLSWRWAGEKPGTLTPTFSPMSAEQLRFLKMALYNIRTMDPSIKYVWIDWSCVPQYSASPMVEVARSKVFYARARIMIVIPEIQRLDSQMEILLRMVETAIQEDPNNADDRYAKMAMKALSTILDEGCHAKLQYFGRVWTLAERLARCSWKEELHHWLSLQLWMGMVVDALVASSSCRKDSSIYWSKLFPETVRVKMDDILTKLTFSLKVGNYRHSGIVGELAQLCVESATVWGSTSMHEVPNKEWLIKYLQVEAISIYKAWNWRDAIWSVLSYFSWKEYNQQSVEGLEDAVSNLCQIAGVEPASTTIWESIQSEKEKVRRASESSLAIPAVAVSAAHAKQDRSLPPLAPLPAKGEENEAAEKAAKEAAEKAAAEAGEKAAKEAAEKAGKESAEKAAKEAEAIEVERASQMAIRKKKEEAEIAAKEQLDFLSGSPVRLLHACKVGDLAAVEDLLKRGADVDRGDAGGATPLFIAATRGHVELLKMLIDAGADVNAVVDLDGESPLYAAASRDHVDAVNFLISRGADIEQCDNNGWTPLTRAAREGNAVMMKTLLDKGANIETKNKNGETPLLVAASWGSVECVRVLLDKGANVNVKNKIKKTALDLARNKQIKVLLQARLSS